MKVFAVLLLLLFLVEILYSIDIFADKGFIARSIGIGTNEMKLDYTTTTVNLMLGLNESSLVCFILIYVR